MSVTSLVQGPQVPPGARVSFLFVTTEPTAASQAAIRLRMREIVAFSTAPPTVGAIPPYAWSRVEGFSVTGFGPEDVRRIVGDLPVSIVFGMNPIAATTDTVTQLGVHTEDWWDTIKRGFSTWVQGSSGAAIGIGVGVVIGAVALAGGIAYWKLKTAGAPRLRGRR